NDTWMLSLSGDVAWRKLSPAGAGPSARYAHVAIYDPVRNRMVIFGGYSGQQPLNDVWALSTNTMTWTSLAPSGSAPIPREWASAIYDPIRDRMVVFGGFDLAGARNDVWALSLSDPPTWSEIVPSGSLPAGRYLHCAAYDPVRDRM